MSNNSLHGDQRSLAAVKGRIHKLIKVIGARLATFRLGMFLLLFPAVFFYLIFLIAPLGVVIYYSLQPSSLSVIAKGKEGLSLVNYLYFFTQPYYVRTIFRTLRFSAFATLGSLVIGYLTSLVLRRTTEKIGSTAVLVLSFPILCGPIVTIMGWMGIMTSKGIFGRALALASSLLRMPEMSTLVLGTDAAVIIGMIHFNLAFVIFNLLNVILVIPRELEEAAMVLGASRWQVFRQILWPLSLPGVFAATLISFALSMNAFINPTYLGNDSRPVLTTQISQFMLTSYNWQMASTTSVLLMIISIVIITLYTLAFSRVSTLQRWAGE